MPAFQNLTGMKFGLWTVQHRVTGQKYTTWLCKCECGTVRNVAANALKCGSSTSCGCPRKLVPGGSFKDLTGMVFGKLTVVAHAGRTPTGKSLWHCSCECGGETRRAVAAKLTSGLATSCGCVRNPHGHCASYQASRTYSSWCAMHQRCRSPKSRSYADYGGRGITVCPEWNDFKQFLIDMGPRPPGLTLDRVDNDIGYHPDNCRWATASQQASNKRKFNANRKPAPSPTLDAC